MTRNISLKAVNDPPVLADIESTFSELHEESACHGDYRNDHGWRRGQHEPRRAVVQITANYKKGQDVLRFVDTGSIKGTWDAKTGKLTLRGTDTLDNYKAVLSR